MDSIRDDMEDYFEKTVNFNLLSTFPPSYNEKKAKAGGSLKSIPVCGKEADLALHCDQCTKQFAGDID